MKYTKIEKEGYTLHLIQTNQFKTISVRANFRTPIKEDLITKRELLAGILSVSSKSYPKRRDFVMRKEELYQLGYGSSSYTSGSMLVFMADLKFIHEKYTEESMNKESLAFFLDTLLHPNIENEAFHADVFSLEKRNYLEFLEGKNDNPNHYASWKFDTLRGRGTPLSFDRSGDADILIALDEKELYKIYNEMIAKDLLDIFVIGDITKEEIEPLFDSYFEGRISSKKEVNHFLPYPKGEPISLKEESSFTQSKLKMGYYIEDMTPFERSYVLRVYNFLLGGSSDSLLFRVVREENSLCYDIHSTSAPLYDMLTIHAGIEAKDYEKTVSLIQESIQKMSEGDFTEEELEKVKLNYKTSYEEIVDSENSILGLYESYVYLHYELLEERMQAMSTVTRDMVVSLAKRVKLDVIYLLEGNGVNE
jgi:predicted Zn-dependent peptidase